MSVTHTSKVQCVIVQQLCCIPSQDRRQARWGQVTFSFSELSEAPSLALAPEHSEVTSCIPRTPESVVSSGHWARSWMRLDGDACYKLSTVDDALAHLSGLVGGEISLINSTCLCCRCARWVNLRKCSPRLNRHRRYCTQLKTVILNAHSTELNHALCMNDAQLTVFTISL